MLQLSELVLEANNLSLYLRQDEGELKIVDDVNLSVSRGEFFALIGESGSGKTMIARAIMRLLSPARLRMSGSLKVTGIDIIHADERTMRKLRGKSISMIFQEPMTSLNPIMSIGEQLAEAMNAHQRLGKAERRDKTHQLLSDVRFEAPAKVAAQFPHELSGGMRQRALIAIAIANDPLLLIADEPTTALDVTIQQEVLEILKRLQDSYRLSVFFISHDLALVNRYADRIGVLYAGVLMESGGTKEVVETPAHPYTAALLACVPGMRVNGLRKSGIDGNVPRVDNWFAGCRFAPRCKQVRASCESAAIEYSQIAITHGARCLYPLK
jgi:peptide/nickel transport system ATP-binding protein